MAKKKVAGRDWKPGQSGNPNGRPPFPKEIRELRILTQIELSKGFNNLLKCTPDELNDRLKDPTITVLEAAVGKILQLAIRNGDQARLSFILDRIVGKVKQEVEVTNSSVLERAKEISQMPPEERIKIAQIEMDKLKDGK